MHVPTYEESFLEAWVEKLCLWGEQEIGWPWGEFRELDRAGRWTCGFRDSWREGCHPYSHRQEMRGSFSCLEEPH